MSALRVPAAELLRIVALNAAKRPMPPHHRRAYGVSAFSHLLTAGEAWFVASVLRIPSLSEKQDSRLRDIELKAERARQ